VWTSWCTATSSSPSTTPDYDTQKRGKVEGYSLTAVQQALDGLSSLVDGLTAFECFSGYSSSML
jgi:hypothetical protein